MFNLTKELINILGIEPQRVRLEWISSAEGTRFAEVATDFTEQVRSLGARFVKVDLGETGETEQGYARALTPEQVERQQAAMEEVIARSDVIITTALAVGRKAPLIVTRDMLSRMKAGSVAVDLAVEANVGRLMLFHHRPERTDGEIDAIVARAQDRANGSAYAVEVVAAREGMQLSL